MADEEKTETTEEETPEVVEEVSDTTETVEEAPAAAEVSDTPAPEEAAAEAEEVSDTGAEAEAIAEVEAEEPAAEAEEAPARVQGEKRRKSLKHVPRSLRRTRSKPGREKPASRKPITRTEKPESELGRRQERRGVVVSDKGDKTIVVKVDVIKSHPKYKKVVRSTVRFHAHDEQNTAGIGDTVRIIETRPLSKTKRWRLAEIVEKAR
jgi:small subunit ribosomal protein S17